MNAFFFQWLMILLPCLITDPGAVSAPGKDHGDFYPFEDKYIDLEYYDLVQPAGFFTDHFKNSTKYAFRFAAPADWMDQYYQEAVYMDQRFTLDTSGALWMTGNSSDTRKQVDKLPAGETLDEVVGNDFVLAVHEGVIRLSRLAVSGEYLLKKFGNDGKVLFEKRILHTRVEVEGNVHNHYPYLCYFGCTPTVLVFTSMEEDYPRTITVNLKNGELASYDQFNIAGFIRDEDESNVPGFITIPRESGQFNALLLNLSWKAKIPDWQYNRAEILMEGEVLYISFYHSIATGSSLYAFKRTTGEQLWQADVKQLEVDHSQYYNTVYLSSRNDKLILEGIEAGGHYVQIFDEKTGARVFSTF